MRTRNTHEPKRSKYDGRDDLPFGFTETEGRKILRGVGGRWNLRMVFEGESYGLRDCLEHQGEPVIEFFDGSADPAKFGELGQFVARYCVSTLTGEDGFRFGGAPLSQVGLCLHGGVPSWSVKRQDMATVMAWLDGQGYPEKPDGYRAPWDDMDDQADYL